MTQDGCANGPESQSAESSVQSSGVAAKQDHDAQASGYSVNRTESSTGAAGRLLFATLLQGVINFALAPLLARGLGPSGRGQQSLVSIYDDASSALFFAGIPQSVGYYAKIERYREGQLLLASLVYGLLVTPLSVGAALLVLRYPLHGRLGPGAAVIAFVLIAASPIAATVGVSARQVLVTRGDLAGLTRLTVVISTSRTLVVLGAYLTGRLNVVVAVLALSGSGYVGNVYALSRARVRLAGPAASLGLLLRYGLRVAPSSLSQLANGRLEQVLLAAFLTTGQIGLYATAVTLNFVVLQIGTTVGLAAYNRTGHNKEALMAAAALVRQTWWLLILAATPVAALTVAGALPLVFGSNFRNAAVPCLLLLPGTIAFASGGLLSQLTQSLGAPGWGSGSWAAILPMLLITIPLLVPSYGLVGAAVASSLSYTAGAIVLCVGVRRLGVKPILPHVDDLISLSSRLVSLLVRRLRATPS